MFPWEEFPLRYFHPAGVHPGCSVSFCAFFNFVRVGNIAVSLANMQY